MSDTPKEGLFVGSRCLAAPSGRWSPATIRSVHADGTVRVEIDTERMAVFQYWCGVTPSELSFDDASRWPAVFAEIAPDGRSIGVDQFVSLLGHLKYTASAEDIRKFWMTSCSELFGLATEEAETFQLDDTTAPALFLRLGQSAKSVTQLLHPSGTQQFAKVYWNQVRMGGRDPTELPRAVTLDDAFAAMGVNSAREDPLAVSALARFESDNKVVLPDTLRQFATRVGIADAVHHAHPNGPSYISPVVEGWKLLTGLREKVASGDTGVVLVNHMCEYDWIAVFDSGEADARVFASWDGDDGDVWALAAPTLGLFFWDLAQTGLGWYQDTNFQGGKLVTTNDIGYVPCESPTHG